MQRLPGVQVGRKRARTVSVRRRGCFERRVGIVLGPRICELLLGDELWSLVPWAAPATDRPPRGFLFGTELLVGRERLVG